MDDLVGGRSDMWILDSYNTDRQWLAPHHEKMCVWPHATHSTTETVFAHKSIEEIRTLILHVAEHTPIPNDGVVQLLLPVQDHSFCFPLRFTKDCGKISKLLGPNIVLKDVDSNIDDVRGDASLCFACVNVCTYRFDELQPVLFAFKDGTIVWEAWGILEDKIMTTRVAPSSVRVFMHRKAFLFNRNAPMLSEEVRAQIRLLIGRIFADAFPEDVSWIIADFLHASINSVTPRQFQKNVCSGTLNYAMARLLRVGWHRRTLHCSISTYSSMSEQNRRHVYVKLKTVMRERNRIFDRQVCRKHTRSGCSY